MKKKRIFMIIFSTIFSLLLLCGTGLLIFYLYKLKGIETYYRYLTIAFVVFLNFVFINGMRYSIKHSKKAKFIILSVLSVILGCFFGIVGYYIQEIYTRLDNFNKTTYEYSTSLITFNEDYKDLSVYKENKDIKIGIVNNPSDIEAYVLAEELIESNDIVAEIAEYDDSEDLMYALYNNRVDAIFVSKDYIGIYSSSDDFEDIADKALEVTYLTKSYTEDEITEIEKLSENYEDEGTETKSLTEPFTILLLGVDSTANTLNKNAAFNGDTIMLVTFNPKTMSATMFSVPRDTFVPIYCSGNRYKKINSAAYGGSNCMVKTLENWTGIDIDYYIKINFQGVVKLVNALGGIDVNVPMDFCESNSKRWKSEENLICLKTGYQHLDGEEALALSRHRKTLILGDFQRGQNQQLVVEGMMNSIKGLRSANDVLEVLDAISNNIDTNITTDQILSLYSVAKDMVFSDNTNMLNIQKTFLRGYDMHVWAGSTTTYSFHNWKGSLNEIVAAMKVNLGEEKVTAIKEMHFSINTEYERYIAGNKQFSETRRSVIPDFLGKTGTYAKSWLSNSGVSVTTKTVSCTSQYYKASYDAGDVVYQSVHSKTLTLNVSSMTLYLNPNCPVSEPDPIIETPDTEETESGI